MLLVSGNSIAVSLKGCLSVAGEPRYDWSTSEAMMRLNRLSFLHFSLDLFVIPTIAINVKEARSQR